MSDEDKQKVHLTSDQKFLCQEMNIDLPFLPFTSVEEYRAYNEFVVDGMPLDEEQAAVEWCSRVDGVNIYPKLPVHIRTYRERWERNQRVRDAVKRAKTGSEKLKELNSVLTPRFEEQVNVTQQVAIPAQPLPPLTNTAQTTEPYVITARTSIGDLPIHTANESVARKRGKDRMKRSGRRCSVCVKCNGAYASICKGNGNTMVCPYFCSICVDNKAFQNASTCPGRENRRECSFVKRN